MGRIVSIDPGKKRTGLAVTDPLQIIATGLTTVNTGELSAFLKKYTSENEVDIFVVGYPKNLDNTDTDSTEMVNHLLGRLKRDYPAVPRVKVDERFTSKMAKQTMLAGGLKRKDRQNKETVDMISATIILQSYMDQQNS
ncbi:MAG: putative Holliday junction resolvase [Granulosicoccus sp.]|jgi:putative Holliday junction resolvase